MTSGQLADGGDSRQAVPLQSAAEESPLGPVALEFVSSIGSDSIDDYLFANIRGIEVDASDNAAVFDAGLGNIRVFSSAGKLRRTFELPNGSGPGEFHRASTFSLSGDKERVYLYDMGNKRVTILDYASFDYIRSFPIVGTQHAMIDGGPDATRYALYTQLGLGRRPLVHVFDEDGNEVTAFEQRHEKYSEYLRLDLQASHPVSLAQSDSLIFLSFALPYDISMYDRQHRLLRKFRGTTEHFGGTFKEDEWTYPTACGIGVVVAGQDMLLQIIRFREKAETWVHAFDFSGRRRGVQELASEDWGTRVNLASDATDSHGMIYGTTSYPFPRVLKFRIEMPESQS